MVKALHYPYAALWVRAHDEELDKLGEVKAMQFVQKDDLPPRTAPIPPTMTYKYKDDSQGNLVHRKARYPVRRDRMVPLTHFDPTQFSRLWLTNPLLSSYLHSPQTKYIS